MHILMRCRPAGKFFFSAGDHQLAALCHLPKALAESKSVKKQDWVDAVIKVLPGAEVSGATWVWIDTECG